jgi:signal transduction histidine kinase
MSLRTRMIVTHTLLTLLPLLALGLGLRHVMSQRLAEQYDNRVESLLSAIDERLLTHQDDLAARLTALRDAAALDQAFLLSVAGMSERSAYLDEFVEHGRDLSGLDLLVVMDDRGRVLAASPDLDLSNRDATPLLRALIAGGGAPGLMRDARLPGAGLALARVDSLWTQSGEFHLLAGRGVDLVFVAGLSGGDDLRASLVFTGGAIVTDAGLDDWLTRAGENDLPAPESVVPTDRYLASGVPFPATLERRGAMRRPPPPLVPARLVLTHPRGDWFASLRNLDLWLLGALALTFLGVVLASMIAAARVTRPLARLAETTSGLDLDRLDAHFPTDRRDEVGVLSRFMTDMVYRLRTGVDRLRAAERRATLGDMARQVNHDIRNGFLPIRNVVWHLGRVAREEPDKLAEVFIERESTLDAGLKHLEDLAGSYKRLAVEMPPEPVDLARLTRETCAAYPVDVDAPADGALPPVAVNPTAMKRVIGNLVRNALESLDTDGDVRVGVRRSGDEILLAVADDGSGLSAEQINTVFEPFVTTKAEGSGLGLSIVRRLVSDAGGRIEVDSTPGRGSTFTLIFPMAGPEASS